MRLWPRSLFGRTALLVAGVVALSQLLSAWLLYSLYADARVERAAGVLAREFKAVTLALDSMSPPQREAYSRALAAAHDIRVEPATTTPGNAPPDRLSARQLERALRAQFAEPIVVRWESTRLWLAGPSEPPRAWIGLPILPLEHELGRIAGVWLGIGGVLGLFTALWLARRINQPMRTLTRAAAQLARGERPHELPEHGPSEIAAVSRAFNQMAHAIERLTTDRTLLLAGVSHDLRTPLARLRLALEMLGTDADARLKEGMAQDVDDMDRIVEQFLAYVRDGEIETVRTGDLNELINASAARYRRQGRTVMLDLVALPALPLRVTAMQRLLTNLVDNALYHGGGKVEVRTRFGDTRIALSVLDRGPGLPPPDTRMSRTRVGLGLVVVERIAQLHQGRLQLLPRDGGGLEARVELPLPSAGRGNGN